MLDAYCAHMGTHLTASGSAMIVKNGLQIEGDSIRCPYHGWKYDVEGNCLEVPSEPAESGFCDKIKRTAYPLVKIGDSHNASTPRSAR